jgi:hypothetical protein
MHCRGMYLCKDSDHLSSHYRVLYAIQERLGSVSICGSTHENLLDGRISNHALGVAATLIIEDDARDCNAPNATEQSTEGPDAGGQGYKTFIQRRLHGGKEDHG